MVGAHSSWEEDGIIGGKLGTVGRVRLLDLLVRAVLQVLLLGVHPLFDPTHS